MEYKNPSSNNELTHWGIKGMRWGIRRYQNKDGSLTPAGRKRYETEMAKIEAKKQLIKNRQETAAKFKAIKDAKKELHDMKRGKSQKENSEQNDTDNDIDTVKAKIIESRSPAALYKNAHLFSTQELNDAYNRLNLERNIKNLAPNDVGKGEKFVDNFVKNSNKASTTIESASKLYNNVAKVFNSLYGNKNNMSLPTIGDGQSKSKLDKFREETDWIRAKNDRRNAEKDRDGTKSDLEKLKDETAQIKAENENRKAKHTKEQYDAGNWNNKEDKNKNNSDSDKKEEEDED